MKKFLAIFLLAASLLSPSSCSSCMPTTPPDDDDTPKVDPFEAFEDAIADNQPNTAVITVSEDTALGVTLTSTFTVTYAANGDATIAYSVEKLLPIDDNCDADTVKETKTGTVNYTKSTNSYSDGGQLVGSNVAASGLTINLDKDYLDYEISGSTLTADVDKEDTLDVIGAALDSDLVLVLTLANDKIASVVASYGVVEITCAYTYAAE